MIATPPLPPHDPLRTECVRYVQPLSPSAKKTEASRIAGSGRWTIEPRNVHLAMSEGAWRLVWATPDGAEEGVWFLKRTTRGYRAVDTWGGVFSDADDRAGGVKWAAKLGVPAPLARCFAAIGIDQEAMR